MAQYHPFSGPGYLAVQQFGIDNDPRSVAVSWVNIIASNSRFVVNLATYDDGDNDLDAEITPDTQQVRLQLTVNGRGRL